MNGLLIHGLDYDDTHLASVVHCSASAFPAVLALAEQRHLSGADLIGNAYGDRGGCDAGHASGWRIPAGHFSPHRCGGGIRCDGGRCKITWREQ